MVGQNDARAIFLEGQNGVFKNFYASKPGFTGQTRALLCYIFFLLTLSKTTNFRLFETERVWRQQFELDENGRKVSKQVETLWEKEKLLFRSNFSFSHSVFKRPLLQARKNQDLFWKGLSEYKCGVRGREVERWPRNPEVPSSIAGSGCQLWDFI